jgi:hypothetical protein
LSLHMAAERVDTPRCKGLHDLGIA